MENIQNYESKIFVALQIFIESEIFIKWTWVVCSCHQLKSDLKASSDWAKLYITRIMSAMWRNYNLNLLACGLQVKKYIYLYIHIWTKNEIYIFKKFSLLDVLVEGLCWAYIHQGARSNNVRVPTMWQTEAQMILRKPILSSQANNLPSFAMRRNKEISQS
jgi:hypothetical protein